MQINRTFWYREKGSSKLAFSYDNGSFALQYAKKYGGTVIKTLNLPDTLQEALSSDSAQVYSVLVNTGELEELNGNSPFLVYFETKDSQVIEDSSHSTIKEANDRAKVITKNYRRVYVVKDVLETQVDESLTL